MSIRNIARKLQQLTGHPYRECLNMISSLGNRPSQTAEKFSWPLARATIYLVDNDLDEEYASARHGARYVNTSECLNCDVTFFVGLDKKGMATSDERLCPSCREGHHIHFCSRCETHIVDPELSLVCDHCWDDVIESDKT